MGSWRRLMALGLLAGFTAVGCVITSGDDDDDDDGASGGSGNSSSGGSSGSEDGGTSGSDGGSSGSSGSAGSGGGGGCSLDDLPDEDLNDCSTCLRDNCCEEFDLCEANGDCYDEFVCAQDCFIQLMEDQSVVLPEDSDACVAGCAADQALITTEMGNLMYCINTHADCSESCTGVIDYSAGGAGGAGS